MGEGVPIVAACAGFVVVNKPGGILSVPGKGPHRADCVVARVRAMFPGATGPMVVHRLDMETSGLMVVALDAPTQAALSAQFARREVLKHYAALLEGDVPGDAGVVDLPLRPDLDRRPYQVVDPVLGRPGRTRWRVTAREGDRTRVMLSPETGRTHQLRVHAADARGIGRAIIGDVLYGRGDGSERLMLHASVLALRDPASRAAVRFEQEPEF